jgi:hypothetical protein
MFERGGVIRVSPINRGVDVVGGQEPAERGPSG